MAVTTSTGPGISQRTEVYAERQMLRVASPIRVLEKTGPLMKAMPKNKGINITFRRPRPFAPLTIPLAEGVTPTATLFSYENVAGTLKQYGRVVAITDVIEDTHEDPVLQDITMQLGEDIARTSEALDYAVLKGGTNVFYANGTQRTDVNTPISLGKQRAVTRALKAQKAMKVSGVLSSSPDYGTRAIEASYVAVAHTDLESDIRDMTGFVPTAEYGKKSMISDHEIGAVEDVRYLISPDLEPFINAGGTPTGVVSTGGSAADVYPVLYFGKEAWGQVALRGQGAVSPSIIPVGQKTKDDPLGQRGYAGYKMWHLALILNQLWMARLEVAASSL